MYQKISLSLCIRDLQPQVECQVEHCWFTGPTTLPAEGGGYNRNPNSRVQLVYATYIMKAHQADIKSYHHFDFLHSFCSYGHVRSFCGQRIRFSWISKTRKRFNLRVVHIYLVTMDSRVLCAVLGLCLVALAAAGPVVDSNSGNIDNSVRRITIYYHVNKRV